MNEKAAGSPARSYWIVAIVALVWNLIGVATYLISVSMSPEALARMPEAERALYTNIPAWATAAYAVAVFAGLLACIGLLLRRAWAVPLFWLSLVGVVVQTGYGVFLSDIIALRGAAALVMPVVVILISAYLVWFSVSAKRQGWLR